jgi:hypothetical protein
MFSQSMADSSQNMVYTTAVPHNVSHEHVTEWGESFKSYLLRNCNSRWKISAQPCNMLPKISKLVLPTLCRAH